MWRPATLALLPLALLACEGDPGPTGPEGPQGPPGPEGPPGVIEVMVQSATVGEDGSAGVTFDNAQVETSLIACWLSETSAGPWLNIGTDLEGPVCGADNQGTSLVVLILGAPSGWVFMATVVAGG